MGYRNEIIFDDSDDDSESKFKDPHYKLLYCYMEKLSDKKAWMREKAVSFFLEALTDEIEQEFVDEFFATLLYRCMALIKKGSAKAMQQAAYVIGLLAMITSYEDKAHEAYEDVRVLLQGLAPRFETPELLDCLAVAAFFGASNSFETEEAMQLIWNSIQPDSHSDSDSTIRKRQPTPVLTAAISAWSLLLSTIDGWKLSNKKWQGAVSYFSKLLDNNDTTVCAAASEALALIFETNYLEKFSTEVKDSHGSVTEGVASIEVHSKKEELEDSIIKQLRSQSTKTSNLNTTGIQDPTSGFKPIVAALEFLEEGNCLNLSVTICGQKLTISTWSEMIQVKFMERFVGKEGFVEHMMKNENFHNVFAFTPKRGDDLGRVLYEPERVYVTVRYLQPSVKDCSLLPSVRNAKSQREKQKTLRREKMRAKRRIKSPCSSLSKARTRLLNKQRGVVQGERELVAVGIEVE